VGSSISLMPFVVYASQISSLFLMKAFHLTQSCVLLHFAWSRFSILTIGVLLGVFHVVSLQMAQMSYKEVQIK